MSDNFTWPATGDLPEHDPHLGIDFSAYSGRWVALSGKDVVGVGDTADAAERFGRRNRSRESLTLRYVAVPGDDTLNRPPLLDQIQPIFDRLDQTVYLVGGAVRDMLLGRTGKDLDFVVAHNAISLSYKVANYLGLPAYVLDKERDAGRVVLQSQETTLDFTRLRGHDLERDLRDRDFTINAIALPSAGHSPVDLVDPCDGQRDIKERVIRLTHPTAILDDPVRGLRGLRLGLELDFNLANETVNQIQGAAGIINEASPERIRDELLKLFWLPVPGRALLELSDLGLLALIMPEIQILDKVEQSPPHWENVLAHTETTLNLLVLVETALLAGEPAVDPRLELAQERLLLFREGLTGHFSRHVDGGLDGRLLLRLGAVYHDAGKAQTQEIEPDGQIRFFGHDKTGAEITGNSLRRLRLSKEAIKHVKSIVSGHMRPLLLSREPVVSRRAVYRFFRDTGSAGLDICLLSLADHLATYQPPGDDGEWEGLLVVVEKLLIHYFDHYASTVDPEPLLDGRELIQLLEIEPGPEVGRLLQIIRESQAAGETATRDEALALARQAHQESHDR